MQRIGDLLKESREKKGLETSYISQTIKIREGMLKALESGDYAFFSSDTHIKSFLKAYAKYLGINEEKALAMYRRERSIANNEEEYESKVKEKSIVSEITQKIFSLKSLLFIVLSIFVITVLSFFYYQWNIFTRPPNLVITSPENNQSLQTESFVIEGITDGNDVKIYVDGNQATFIDSNGRFRVNANFNQPGQKRFTVTAKNEFNLETTVSLDLTYERETQTVLSNKIKFENVSPTNSTFQISIDSSGVENIVLSTNQTRVIEFKSSISVTNFDSKRVKVYFDNDTIPTAQIDTTRFSVIIENARLFIKTEK